MHSSRDLESTTPVTPSDKQNQFTEDGDAASQQKRDSSVQHDSAELPLNMPQAAGVGRPSRPSTPPPQAQDPEDPEEFSPGPPDVAGG